EALENVLTIDQMRVVLEEAFESSDFDAFELKMLDSPMESIRMTAPSDAEPELTFDETEPLLKFAKARYRARKNGRKAGVLRGEARYGNSSLTWLPLTTGVSVPSLCSGSMANLPCLSM